MFDRPDLIEKVYCPYCESPDTQPSPYKGRLWKCKQCGWTFTRTASTLKDYLEKGKSNA